MASSNLNHAAPLADESLLRLRWAFGLGLVVVLGFLLRKSALTQGLWINEVVSMEAARLNVPALLHRTGFFDIQPPFYYLALSAWTGLFGDSDAAARMLSLLCAGGGLVTVFALGRMIRSPWTGLLAALLLAFSTFHVHYSVEVRSVALLTLLGALFFLQYETLMRRPELSLQFYVALGIVEVALVLTHYYAAVLLLVANAHFFTSARTSARRLYRWSVVQGLAFAAFLFWSPLMLVQFFHLPEIMYAAPLESSVLHLHALYLGLSPVHPASMVAWLSSMLVLSAVAWGTVQSFRIGRDELPRRPRKELRLTRGQTLGALATIAACLAAPAVVALALPASESTAPLLYFELPRSYLLAFVGLFFLLIGNFYNTRVAGSGHRLPATATLFLGTLVILLLLFALHRPFQPHNWGLLLPAFAVLAASFWHPRWLLGKVTLVVLVMSLAFPSLEREDRAFFPRQDFQSAASLIRDLPNQGGSANFVLPMWDRPGLEYYLGAGTANGIMSPAQLPPAAILPGRVSVVLTRRAFEQQALFLENFAAVLGDDYKATDAGQVFKGVAVAVYERTKAR